MYVQLIINFSIILGAYVLQSSLISALPSPFNLISLPLIIIVLITYVAGWRWGSLAAGILGLLMTHESHLWIGSLLITYFIITLVTSLLSEKVLTNKSLYSNSLLCLAGTILQILLITVFNLGFYRIGLTEKAWLWPSLGQIILNVVISDIIFSVLILFRKELKSYFIYQ